MIFVYTFVYIALAVLKLLQIRKNTFAASTVRFQDDYYDYDGEGVFMEHPLAFYPNNRLIQYPKKYEVGSNIDKDFCAKSYPSHSDFLSGVFTIGCSCSNPITTGFELMTGAESPRILFRMLMTGQFDRQNLEGIIYENACGLHWYFLNGEPKDCQNLRFLVDGCHFQGQKRMKKSNKNTGAGGHLGCSSSYNFMQYKMFTKQHQDGASNSQNREQMHSVLNRLATSLRQMNYHNFMRTLIIYIRNLKLINKLCES